MTRLQPWTPHEDAYLLVALERAVPLATILKTLNRPEGGIKARLHRLGYNPRSSDPLSDLREKVQAPPVIPAGAFKAGYRPDIDISVRSGWEANIARWFNSQAIDWQYEPRTFYFPNLKRGARAYLPDFYLTTQDKWIEVKGRLKSTDRTKLKRFLKYCPEESSKLQGIPKNTSSEAAQGFRALGIPIYAYYDDICAEAENIPGWE